MDGRPRPWNIPFMGRASRLAAALLVVGLLGCEKTEPPVTVVVAKDMTLRGEPGLRIVSGNYRSDTVDAERPAGLVVELFDAAGHPAAGALIRVAALSPDPTHSDLHPVFVAPSHSTFDTIASVLTDARGRASIDLKFGPRPGTAGVAVTAVGFSATGFARDDTAHFSIETGAAVGLVYAPLDTALYIDGSLSPRGGLVDRHGNLRAEVLSWRTNPTIVVGDGPVISALGYGRASYNVSAGRWSQVAWISVVPRATIAVHRSDSDPEKNGIFRVGLDGSVLRRLSSIYPAGFASAPTWVGRNRLVYSSSVNGIMQLFSVDLTGNVTPFLRAVPPALYHQVWPRERAGLVFFAGYELGRGASLWSAGADGNGAIERYRDASGSVESPAPSATAVAISVGGVVRLVYADSVSSWTMSGRHPRFSPDGNRIAYTSNSAPNPGALHVINADGTGYRRLSQPGALYADQAFDWSSDGRWIIARGETTLELIEAATGLTIPLPYASQMSTPAWRPPT